MRACHESPAGVSSALALARLGGGQTVEESIFLLGTGGGCFGVSIPPWSGQSCVCKG